MSEQISSNSQYAHIISQFDSFDNNFEQDTWRFEESVIKFKNLFETSPIGVGLLNKKGTMIAANPALEQMTGFSHKDFNISAHFVSEEDVSVFQSQLHEQGIIKNWNIQVKTKNDQVYDVIIDLMEIPCIEHEYFLFVEKTVIQLSNTPRFSGKTHQQLQQSLQDCDLLLGEIHHRVKNNLQIIMSLIDLQFQGKELYSDPIFLDEIKNRIYLMSLLHDQLYRSDDFKYVKLGGYIKDIVDNLEKSYLIKNTNISTMVENDQSYISINKAISCGLIVNELVSNSMRHAFTDDQRGTITISFSSSNDYHLIIISDSGIGFPKTIDFYHPTSLGLQLVHMLIQQLKGTITLKTNGGTTFTFSFPKEKAGVMDRG